MSITSFSFLTLITVGMLFYYISPKSWQWIDLLVISLLFYYFAASPYTILYLLVSVAITYGATITIDRMREKDSKSRLLAFIAGMAIAANILMWFIVKGSGLWKPFVGKIAEYLYIPKVNSLLNIHIISALGMGYYTLQVIGYIIDCYWENIVPQKNPLKLILFVVYFPQLTTGPISRYAQLECLYENHTFRYSNICLGAQRILWGFFKKIVLAERVGAIVAAIAGNSEVYTGFYSWMMLLLYPLQMYADFSGCMDIVIGVSELFGIKLAENFNNPFFARSSQEFWQRWHISLGGWAKDYVLYPLLKSDPMIKLGKYTRKRYGKATGKFLVNLVGMFVLWMVMGIWHGGYRYIVGVSLWYWTILMLGNLLSPIFTTLTTKCNMKTDSFGWHFFQSGRTYLIYAIGATFFNVGVKRGLALLYDAWKVITVKDYANPWIFFDGSVLNLGVTYGDINIIMIGILLLVITAALREKYGFARVWIQKQSVLFRWGIWLFLFVIVLVYGKYGPGYNSADFIYQGF